MRLAFVHDHLTQQGGAERVLEALQALWPNAPTFTLLYDKSAMGDTFAHKNIRPSFLEKIPFAHRFHRYLLPLMPTATEAYDLSAFDIVVSNSSGFAKGVLTRPSTVHICYCHTPTRYLWHDTLSYIDELHAPGFIKKLLPPFLTYLRTWDRLAADRVDVFVANSETVKQRIAKYYRKDAVVVSPPVDVEKFAISDAAKTYYLVGGRLVPYKRFDVVVDAFTKLGLPLKIFGTGPAEASLRRRAGENITFLGRVSDDERARLFADAIAFIHPHEEDFGITAVESMAAGRPVVAYAKDGALETVKDGVTGILFTEQSWEELASTVLQFDHTRFSPSVIREHALTFSVSVFRRKMKEIVERAYADRHRH